MKLITVLSFVCIIFTIIFTYSCSDSDFEFLEYNPSSTTKSETSSEDGGGGCVDDSTSSNISNSSSNSDISLSSNLSSNSISSLSSNSSSILSSSTSPSSTSSTSSTTSTDCPEGMIKINNTYCIDKYEASRTDATNDEEGSASTINDPPKAGVKPYRIYGLSTAENRCASVGKRVCSPTEWETACKGPNNYNYTYGNNYVQGKCSDYLSGYGVDPTGSFTDCTNEYGIYDMSGNLWELDSDGNTRGGAHNCNSDWWELHSCSCDFEDPNNPYVPPYVDSCPVSCGSAYCGFRCCKDL